MTIQYYIGGKIVGLAADIKPLNVPENTTFIESDTFTEFILVSGVWEQVGTIPFDLNELKSYWKFDEVSGDIINQTAAVGGLDGLGAGADLQVTDGVYSQPGVIGTALLYNGTTSLSVAGTSFSQYNFLHNQNAIFTHAFWYATNDLTPIGNNSIFGTSGSSSNGEGINIFQLVGTRQFHFSIGNGSQRVLDFDSGANFIPNDNNFHFYILDCDLSLGSNNAHIYIDNVLEQTITKTANPASASDQQQAATVGAGFVTGNLLDGLLDEYSIWNRLLTNEERADLWNDGNGRAL